MMRLMVILYLETDAVCANNLKPLVDEFLKQPNPHILFFQSTGYEQTINTNTVINKLTNRFYGTWAYYITKEGAKRCLEYALPIEEQIDSYLSIYYFYLN